jgi:hypothetical protein
MTTAIYSITELASIFEYPSVRTCAKNMLRAYNCAKDRYPQMEFETRSYTVSDRIVVDDFMCRDARYLTACFCANTLSKTRIAQRFFLRESAIISAKELIKSFEVEGCYDAQILQVLLGIPERSKFICIVESIFFANSVKSQQVWWEYNCKPRSCSYILSLTTTKTLVRQIRNSIDFGRNPMRELIIELDNYFTGFIL